MAVTLKKKANPLALNEYQIQCQCIQWFNLQYPQMIIYAIPNGVRVSIGLAVKLKRMGLKRSVPDLHVPHRGAGYLSLYIEMKQPGNYPRSDQKEMMDRLKVEGHYCAVCRSLDDFKDTVDWYFHSGGGGK